MGDDLLEFGKVKELYARYTFSQPGKKALMALKPSTSPWAELSLVQEMIELLGVGIDPPISRDFNVEDLLEKLESGSVLEPGELLRMEDFLRGCEELKRFGKKLEGRALGKLLLQITPVPDAVDRIRRTISHDGGIKDGASKKLSDIRRKLRELGRDLKRKLEHLRERYRSFLQDDTYVLRDGRYLFPVKSNFRNKVKGIVHHASSSGATLFVEPEDLIPMNDTKKILEEEERREESRILREISSFLFSKISQMRKALAVVAHFDSIYARALYAIEEGAVVIHPGTSGKLKLVRARHPLIPKDRVVPITLELNKKGLVITGPNMGGKTVTLKTIGLFTILAMSGFPVPASEQTELSVFEKVLVDIGEEQDIEQSLSSFSSHMGRIVEILEQADSKSLVLIDELGTGTDPVEGSALGLAIIEELLDRDCRFVVTTHMSSIKIYALQREELENASMEFDPRSLKPTYRILMGVPGASHAFEIASSLGLPRSVLERARKHMSGESVVVESVIKKLQSEIARLEGERKKLETEREELSQRKREYERKYRKLKEGKIEEYDRSLRELSRKVDNVLKELEKAIHTLKKKDIEKIRESVKSLMNVKRELKETRIEMEEGEKIEVGSSVKIRGGTSVGKVLEDRGEKVLVSFGGKKIEMRKSDLVPTKESPEKTEEMEIPRVVLEKPEVDIRGMTVEEAETAVLDFIDRLVMSDFNRGVIIHGKGSGKLAVGVWEILRKDSRVKNYRFGMQSEGGIGVTIVEV